MSVNLDLTKWRNRVGGVAGLLLVAACAAPQQMAAVPAGPIPPGQARIWFYRVYDPSLSRNIANVDLNGARAVSILPGDGPAYRDVPAGAYYIAPESIGVDTNQTRNVQLAAGQEIYVKILDDPLVVSSGDRTQYQRDTFYAWVMPPAIARAEMRM
jgi:hypothetical protein